MQIRLLIACPERENQSLMEEMLTAAMGLIPLDVTTECVHSQEELTRRLLLDKDDVILLDWSVAQAGTPELVRSILARNPRLRVVALLPLQLRQYRQSVWDAGACNSVPREHMDQEWLSSLLCIMHRAMQREARLLEQVS